ncbi:CBS domain-containing protein [Rhizosaccharibacter radicis]|uniref:CBS domain-containing protein n=1 Tax=Rhizosaccharibacter radicis TaxID=2782605 RepID=A0ABT1VTS9_9PROT|nr:CBS domain-containing protein [Acetobacteraceae bacterium KSS12]
MSRQPTSQLAVSEIMTRFVEFLEPDATAKDAAVLMGELDVGALPVGTEDRLLGVVTDRDLLYRVTAEGLTADTPVQQVMSHPVLSCSETDTVQAALDMMAAHHVRRLPVRITNGARIAGWVTLGDLSRRLLVESRLLQDALQDVTERDRAAV